MKAKGGWMNMGYTNKKINEIHSFPCKYSKLRAKNQQRVCVCKSNIMDDMWRGGCAWSILITYITNFTPPLVNILNYFIIPDPGV